MKTRPLFFFLPALALVMACGYFSFPTLFASPSVIAQQPEQPQMLNTPEIVYSIPSPESSPTIGYQATIEVISTLAAGDRAAALNSREQELIAREAANAAEANLVQATNEAENRARDYIQMTAVVEASTATAYPTSVPLTAQAQATADAFKVAAATQQIVAATGTAYAPTQVVADAKAKAEAERMPLIVAMEALKPLFLFLTALVVLAPFAYVFLRSGKEAEPILEPGVVGTDELRIKLEQTDAYGWGKLRFETLPIAPEILRNVAVLISEQGRRYTQAQMTGAGNPLVKGGTFEIFGAWMVENKIARQLEDGRYLVDHPEFFEQVLQA